MLTITCGSYPSLETALADDVMAVKAADPLAPVIIVVPSDSLRRRIVRLLAGERKRAFLSASVLTFHQLSRRLVEESIRRPLPPLVDDQAYEELMRVLLDRENAGHAFAGVAATRGGGAALWQTLRDLKDAKVPPRALAEAVAESLFPAEAASRLAGLAGLYGEVLSAAETAGWVDYTDLDVLAAAAAPSSGMLKTQRLVAYYGFYDLTQAQYDVLRAVSGAADAAVYFPFVSGDPSWAFADRFLTRYLTGVSTRPVRFIDGPVPSRPSVTLVSCSGVTDEVRACAKAILALVEDEGLAFEDIGVVSRSLDPYADAIAREFARHHLPLVTTATRPLSRHPLAQAALRLARIAEGAPAREDVIDFVASPWCRVERLAPHVHADPALWDELARSVGVRHGYEAWSRLAALVGPDGGPETGSSSRGAQAAVLLQVVNGLRRACGALPETASGSSHADAWRGLLASLLGIEREADASDDDPDGVDAVASAVLAAFDAPARLDVVTATMTKAAYLDVVRRRIESTALPLTDPHARGVQVMDAASARGTACRALFLLGLNEGVFPRVIREDAFLRDQERRLIETTLGYKIPEKLAGYEEERLLFAALTGGGGRDRVVLSTQRADDAGRALAPSWYVAPWRDEASNTPRVDVPRRTREKPRVAPFARVDRLTPQEASVLAELVGVRSVAVADGRTREWLVRAASCRDAIEAWATTLSAFDGDVGTPEEWLARQREAGYAATGLATYAACPWQFFVTRVLDVSPSSDAEVDAGPTARDWGLLAHEAIARAARDSASDINAIWREVCARYARRAGIGYPLVWDLAVERIGRVVAEVAADDAGERDRSGYTVIETEVALRGELGADPVVPIQGRLDRLDQAPDKGLRVIDWKFRDARGANRRNELVAEALRGRGLQPPIYEALAQRYALTRLGKAVGESAAVVYEVGLNERDAGIEREPYAPDPDMRTRILGTVRALVDGIEQGVFPMNPDAHCAWCEVAASCRRRHAPSRARAERDPRSVGLDRIRRAPVRPPKEPG
ncbi:MAG TPA: PD-(D/E)XK nuclease family protein [Nitrospiria bacterium]|nr:PD-(D/E)XK nuclease family protein [Nitrospiria bacterium]